MNTVTIVDNNLVVEPQGLDKLWSFKRRLEIPLASVRGATFVVELTNEHYDRLILTVNDPRALVDRINAALQDT